MMRATRRVVVLDDLKTGVDLPSLLFDIRAETEGRGESATLRGRPRRAV